MELIGELKDRPKQQFGCGYIAALIYIGLGDKTKAIDCLEREYLDHDNITLPGYELIPMLDPLRGDPRFETLADKIIPISEFKRATAAR